MAGRGEGRRGAGVRPGYWMVAVALIAVTFPFARVAAAPPPYQPPLADLGASWVVGFASTPDRLVVASDDEVLTVSPSGTVLQRRSLAGTLRGMALSPDGASIYLTRIDPSGVDRLDLTTLATTASITFASRLCPKEVVPAGGRVWMELECSASPLASVDGALTNQPQTVPAMPTMRSMAASADSSRLFVREGLIGYEQARLSVVDPTDPTATPLKTVPLDGNAQMGMAASPDGASLVVGGLPVRVLDARTLETRTTLQSFHQIDQVVVTGDSRHIVGSSRSQAAGFERDVLWWTMGSPAQIGNERPANPEQLPRLAASPDGRNVHILGNDGLLRILPIGPDPARLEVALDPGPAPGLVRVHGTLRLEGASPAGRPIVVARASPLAPPVPLPAMTGPDGTFSLVDQAPPGAFTYRVRWAGDGTHSAALAVASGGMAAAPTIGPATGLPDRAVPIPANTHILLLDDVHGRLLLDSGGPPGTVAVADLEGNPTGSLVLPAPVLGMVRSDAGTDLFAVLGDGAGIAVIDGATLDLAGIVSPGPLVPVPTSATIIGGRLWVSGGNRYPNESDPARLEIIDLADPVDAVAVSVGHWGYGTRVFADPSDAGFAYVANGYELRRLDLSTEPPTPTTTAPLQSSSLGTPIVGFVDGTLVTASNRLIRDVDAATLRLRRERTADATVNGLAPGPGPGLFAASTGAFYAPDEGGVQIWGPGATPIHRYRFPERSADSMATTRDGSRAFAISRQAGSAIISPEPIPTYLHVLHDPFRACRILPGDVGPLTGGLAATITGVLTTPGGTPQPGTVTVGIGGASVTVPAGTDGRFTAVLAPSALGSTTVSFSAGGNSPQACAATQPVTIGPLPDGPPSAPTGVTAAPSRDAAIVRWSPPATDGGAAVTGYRVEASVGGSTVTVTATAGQREIVISPLPSTGPTQVTVRASNRHGWGQTASTPASPGRWWPFTTPAALVERQYLDILERPPTAAETSSWVAALTNGTATVAGLAVTLYYSVEATNGPLAVAQLWITGTNQFLDPATLSLWVGRLRTGTTLSTFGRAIAQHPGFTARYGGLGNRPFVDALARDLLGASLTAATANQWAALLALGKLQRGDVFAFFALQPQARTRWAPWVGTDLVLVGQLGTTPSPDLLISRITGIANGSLTLPTVIDDITRSPGYGARFGAP